MAFEYNMDISSVMGFRGKDPVRTRILGYYITYGNHGNQSMDMSVVSVEGDPDDVLPSYDSSYSIEN